MDGSVSKTEYDNHKDKCGKSFEDVFDRMDRMDRAMFGEPDLKRKGVFDMTSEMYNSVMTAKGGEKIFWGATKIAGSILTITGSFWAVWELITRIKIK